MKLLEVKDLTVRYGSLTAVQGFSFSVEEGETVVLLGPNGCGKSSVLLAIMGVVRPASGKILYRGQDLVKTKPWHRVSMGMAMLPENRRLFDDLTVEENLRLAAESLGHDVALSELQAVLPEPLRVRLNVPCRLLSGGERQLVAIVRLKLQRPQLALLDDPLAGVGLDLWPEMVEMVHGAKGILLAAPRRELPFKVDRVIDMRAVEDT